MFVINCMTKSDHGLPFQLLQHVICTGFPRLGSPPVLNPLGTSSFSSDNLLGCIRLSEEEEAGWITPFKNHRCEREIN